MAETAKEIILARIRAALADAPKSTPVPRAYRQHDERDRAAILAELSDRLREYKTQVKHVAPEGLADAIAAARVLYAIRRLVMPADLPAGILGDVHISREFYAARLRRAGSGGRPALRALP